MAFIDSKRRASIKILYPFHKLQMSPCAHEACCVRSSRSSLLLYLTVYSHFLEGGAPTNSTDMCIIANYFCMLHAECVTKMLKLHYYPEVNFLLEPTFNLIHEANKAD